jgi:hypothetical protein
MAHHLHELILVKALWYPEGDVFVASGELRIGLEFVDLPLSKLINEAGILTPEETDVIDIKELHGPALKSQAESPTNFILYVLASACHDLIVDDSTPKYFEPLIIIEDLQLN